MTENEFRIIFDTIPEAFDRYRTRYCPQLFASLLEQSKTTAQSSVLELGPGTGQAAEPLLDVGCDYSGIELGKNFAAVLNRKYGNRANFHLIHDDFITHDFGTRKFDLIYSAATIQWIPEETAFGKTFSLLKPGGMLAMFLTRRDYRTPNPALFEKIQQVYDQYFKPEIPYSHGSFCYENALKYGRRTAEVPCQIRISGTADESHLSLKISDNGEGFDWDTLNQLRKNFRLIEKNEQTEEPAMQAHLGLINTYRRLYYYSHGAIHMDIYNQNGAVVELIEELSDTKEEVTEDV